VKRIAILAATAIIALIPAGFVHAQSQGPVSPPPSKSDVKKTPLSKDVPPPPIPEDEIVRRFAANEERMKKAYDQYSFTLSVKVEEESNPGGQFVVTGDMYMKSDGQRYERIVKPPLSTLKQTSFTLEDVKTIASLPLFYLTSTDVPNYKFKYRGTEKMDQLDTYVFRVQPKTLARKQRFFDGVIWVDQRDLAIVKSSGKFVKEVEDEPGTQLPFTMFDTYRENIAGQYWFPTFITSEDMISPAKNESIPLKLVVRSTNFQPNPIAVSAAPAQPATNTAASPTVKPN
jgi:hypothetical protein